MYLQLNLNTNIKQWYKENYSDDNLAYQLRDITFLELFKNIDRGICVYETINVCDSIIRERLFIALSTLFNTDYNYIYNKWLYNNNNN